MKFLVTIRNRPPTSGIVGATAYAATAARAIRLAASTEVESPWTAKAQDESWVEFSNASKAWFRANEAAGRVEAGYMFPEGGGIMVVNADSHEELHDLIFSNPGASYLEHEVQPLLEFDVGMDKLASSFAAGVGGMFARLTQVH